MQIDPTLLGTIATALIGGVGAIITLLIKTLTSAYDKRIADLVAERDHYRMLAEAQRGELERNSAADDRALSLLTARLSVLGTGVPRQSA